MLSVQTTEPSCFLLYVVLSMENLCSLQAALWEIQSKWYNLGVALGFSPGDLKTIEVDQHYQSGDCLRELLIKWLRLHDQPLESLQEALKLPQMQLKLT